MTAPRFLGRLARNSGGSVYIEVAFALPILVFLTTASIELGRYLLLNQKLQNAAMNLADLAARDETLTESQLNNLFTSVQFIAKPFDFAQNGQSIVTSVSATVDNNPVVYWQRLSSGTLGAVSEIGAPGDPATIPADLPIRADETIIAAEVYYDYEPFFGILLSPGRLRHVAYFRPRLGSLQALAP